MSPVKRMLLVAALGAVALGAVRPAVAAVPRRVVIDFYYEPGCAECDRLERDVLPVLRDVYAGQHVLNRWDLGVETNYLRLVTYMDRFGCRENARVFMVVDERRLLAGYDAIAAGLLDAVENSLQAPAPVPPPARDARTVLAEWVRGFTFVGVLFAGLVDSLNPCAISTLVFFLGVLSLGGVQRRTLLAAGVAFCAASFLTYLALGLGLLRVLQLFRGLLVARALVDGVLAAVLLVLAILSLRDAWRFQRTHDPRAVALQLPDALKRLSHRLVRQEMRLQHAVLAAFLVGAAVTLIESACTGQVYVPALVFIMKSGSGTALSIAYLLAYNLMFVLPMVLALVLVYRGLQFRRLADWSARNVVSGKLLMAGFFILMAALILIL